MERRKRESPQEGGGAPEWMTTYSDLVTLLLCFFVLLFSMAVIDKQKFIEVANSLRSSFSEINSGGDKFDFNKGNTMFNIFESNTPGVVSNEQEKDNPTNKDTEMLEEDKKKKLENLQKEMEAAISELKLDEHITVIVNEHTITLRMDSILLFDSGSADIKTSSYEVLSKTGQLLKGLDNEIFIQGHTDNRPINTRLFPSNWELSTKRATNVTLYLINNVGLDPSRLTATGNGEYKPIHSNDSEKNRQKNRRIDIVLIK